MAKLFDVMLAHELDCLDPNLGLEACAAALNRRGFQTFTGLRWNAKNLRAARIHAFAPRPSRYSHALRTSSD